MNAPARLSLYGLSLVVVFAVAFFTANLVVDDDAVQHWVEDAPDHGDHGDAHDG